MYVSCSWMVFNKQVNANGNQEKRTTFWNDKAKAIYSKAVLSVLLQSIFSLLVDYCDWLIAQCLPQFSLHSPEQWNARLSRLRELVSSFTFLQNTIYRFAHIPKIAENDADLLPKNVISLKSILHTCKHKAPCFLSPLITSWHCSCEND